MNLFVSCEVKRCNLSLSTGLITVPAVPFLLAWDHFTFPVSLLWLGAHLTPIKTSTFKSKSWIGAGWKSIFFPPLPFFSFFLIQPEANQTLRKHCEICPTVRVFGLGKRELSVKATVLLIYTLHSRLLSLTDTQQASHVIHSWTNSVHVGMVLKDCCYLPLATLWSSLP